MWVDIPFARTILGHMVLPWAHVENLSSPTNLLGELFRVYPITVLGVLEWTVLRSKRIEPIVFGTFWSADCAGRKNQWHMDFCE